MRQGPKKSKPQVPQDKTKLAPVKKPLTPAPDDVVSVILNRSRLRKALESTEAAKSSKPTTTRAQQYQKFRKKRGL